MELVPGGATLPVTHHNLPAYVASYSHVRVGVGEGGERRGEGSVRGLVEGCGANWAGGMWVRDELRGAERGRRGMGVEGMGGNGVGWGGEGV